MVLVCRIILSIWSFIQKQFRRPPDQMRGRRIHASWRFRAGWICHQRFFGGYFGRLCCRLRTRRNLQGIFVLARKTLIRLWPSWYKIRSHIFLIGFREISEVGRYYKVALETFYVCLWSERSWAGPPFKKEALCGRWPQIKNWKLQILDQSLSK